MLDQITVFNQAGPILWSKSLAPLKGDPLNELIRNIFLEGRFGATSFISGQYEMKWKLINEFHVVIVAVYQKVIRLPYVEELLEKIKNEIIERYGPLLKQIPFKKIRFDKHFEKILYETEKKLKSNADSPIRKKVNLKAEIFDDSKMEAARSLLVARKSVSNRQKQSEKNGTPTNGIEEILAEQNNPKNFSKKLSKKEMANLDRSKKISKNEISKKDLPSEELDQSDSGYDSSSSSSSDERFDETAISLMREPPKGWKNSFLGKLIFGGSVLTLNDIEPALNDMRSKLMAKNVAADVCKEICESVKASLLGQEKTTFTRVKTIVQNSLRESIQRILTPKNSIDLMRGIGEARKEGKLYSVVVMGINGVGKSTSLAKVAYFLKQGGVNTLLAACDTYRSGAVEQLRVHSKCLDIPLFEMGYAKDPASVALCAQSHAHKKNVECLLIDTAGRMQNNRPLMAALGRLVGECKPDLCLFVGEALVGNDGIDQIAMFNDALASCPGSPHSVDAIILTKFDTVDSKVGAALSMCHKTGQPILFVGTGQKYTHLRQLDVDFVLKALFS